jgi:hypothetical protein
MLRRIVVVILVGLTLTTATPAAAADYGSARAARLTIDPCREDSRVEQPVGCLAAITFTPRCRAILVTVFADRWRTGPVTRCPFARTDHVIWPDAAGGSKRIRYAIVEPGDNLYRIGLHAYRDGRARRLIKRTNRIADVRTIRPGQLLILPPAP